MLQLEGTGTLNIKNWVLWLSPSIKCVVWKNKLSYSEVGFFYESLTKTFLKHVPTYVKYRLNFLNMDQAGTIDYRTIGTFGAKCFYTIITREIGLKALNIFSQNTQVNCNWWKWWQEG